MFSTTAERTALRIALGQEVAACFDAGPPVLAGEAVEDIFGDSQPAGQVDEFTLFASGEWLLGIASVAPRGDLAGLSRRLYGGILSASRGRHLVRIWNYVPAINQSAPSGLENYREFCRGRSEAFEHWHGANFRAALPAASAVGTNSGELTVLFAANSVAPRHFENPLQVPAYDYPPEYGPRAPSFSRASIVAGADQSVVFVSGTAAIRGHRSVAPHCTQDQVDCALENLKEISRAARLGSELAAGECLRRHFKVYLRHPAELSEVAGILEGRLFREGDRVTYLHAAICRAELNIEIEATLWGAAGDPG
jgi:chorismate lyase/3-hydroxybenzoate synthase